MCVFFAAFSLLFIPAICARSVYLRSSYYLLALLASSLIVLLFVRLFIYRSSRYHSSESTCERTYTRVFFEQTKTSHSVYVDGFGVACACVMANASHRNYQLLSENISVFVVCVFSSHCKQSLESGSPFVQCHLMFAHTHAHSLCATHFHRTSTAKVRMKNVRCRLSCKSRCSNRNILICILPLQARR